MKVKDVIKQLQSFYSEDTEICSIVWGVEDVLITAEEQEISCSKSEAEGIIRKMDKRHDCTIGITWDTIHMYLWDLQEERKAVSA